MSVCLSCKQHRLEKARGMVSVTEETPRVGRHLLSVNMDVVSVKHEVEGTEMPRNYLGLLIPLKKMVILGDFQDSFFYCPQ